jgi:beta-glucosidase
MAYLISIPKIPQLYLTRPASSNSPPYVLRGFESVYLEPGQSTLVSMGLSRYDFSIWDIVQQKWVIPKGTTGITVGSSSRNHKLKGSVSF